MTVEFDAFINRMRARMGEETAMQRAKRIVDEFHHEIGMSIEQAGRLTGAIAHEIERHGAAAEKREKYAIEWANRSVDSVKEADDAIIAGLRKALEGIERGTTSVLLTAKLRDEPIDHDVLDQIRKDAIAALATPPLVAKKQPGGEVP